MKKAAPQDWISARSRAFDSSGIRKVFDSGGKAKDPINLSIGQPDFDVPQGVKQACIDAIEQGKNSYSLTQGINPLRERLKSEIDRQWGHTNREVFISSGTSGGLVLAMLSLVDPGDEVIIFDPYFVMYPPLVQLVGGTPIIIDTYPDFRIDVDKVRAAITDKTKLILFNSPANPTGVTPSVEEVRQLATLAAEHNIALILDEIYSQFVYDEPLASPAEFNSSTIVIYGFSKSHAMTGWRVGWVHGPAEVIQTMIKLQQYSFVCALNPHNGPGLPQWMSIWQGYCADYRQKRDMLIDGLKDRFEFVEPGGAFYCSPASLGQR